MTKEAGPATPRTDAFSSAMYNESQRAAFEGYLESSPEEAYGAAIDFARTLERELLAAEERIKMLQEAKRPWTPEHTKSVIDGQVKEIDRLTGAVQAERAAKEQAERRAAELEAAWTYNWMKIGPMDERAAKRCVAQCLKDHQAALSSSKGGGVGE